MRFKHVFALAAVLLVCAGPALAQDRVLNTRPQADAAILPYAPGLGTFELVTPVGRTMKHNEGVVIRGSYIEDGKIHIPPSGIYYTDRGWRAYQGRADMLIILAQPYYVVSFDTHASVVTDLVMEPGDSVVMVEDKLLTLLSIDPDAEGHGTPMAFFRVFRPSGMYATDVFTVSTTPDSMDVSTFELSGKASGLYDLTPDFRFDQRNWTTDLSAWAGKSLKAADLTEESVRVVEAIIHSVKQVYVTQTLPVTGYYGAGDQASLGGFTVDVLNVDEAAGSATVRLTDAQGNVTEQVLGPMPDMELSRLLNSELELHQLVMSDPTHTVMVQMSPWRRTGLFMDGKVALNLWADVQLFTPGMDWPDDSAWIYRPDT